MQEIKSDQFDSFVLRNDLPDVMVNAIQDYGMIREPPPSALAMKKGFVFLDDFFSGDTEDPLDAMIQQGMEEVGYKYQ